MLNFQYLAHSCAWGEQPWIFNNYLQETFWDSHFRSSHQRCSLKKGAPGKFEKFIGKHLCQILFSNKVAGLRLATLLKKRSWHRCFPVNFAKFLRTPLLQNTSGRLLLTFLERIFRGISTIWNFLTLSLVTVRYACKTLQELPFLLFFRLNIECLKHLDWVVRRGWKAVLLGIQFLLCFRYVLFRQEGKPSLLLIQPQNFRLANCSVKAQLKLWTDLDE